MTCIQLCHFVHELYICFKTQLPTCTDAKIVSGFSAHKIVIGYVGGNRIITPAGPETSRDTVSNSTPTFQKVIKHTGLHKMTIYEAQVYDPMPY